MPSSSLSEATTLTKTKSNILVFTGAGMSTRSGIPDFRGPQGVWKRRQPVYIDDFLSNKEARLEYWNYKREGYAAFKAAKPNNAHHALVELEKESRLLGVVTQNVDGLHSIAGHTEEKVIEIHGTNRKVACLHCDHWEEPARAFQAFEATGKPPMCPQCAGWLKPATISFGQSLIQKDLEKAESWALDCDLVISLGSTLSVHPAASIPLKAARHGAPYIVVNQGETDHDLEADYLLSGDVVDIVPTLLKSIST